MSKSRFILLSISSLIVWFSILLTLIINERLRKTDSCPKFEIISEKEIEEELYIMNNGDTAYVYYDTSIVVTKVIQKERR